MSGEGTRNDDSPQPGLASVQDRSDASRAVQRALVKIVPRLRAASQAGREFARRLRGGSHRVDFFHQVDDPYSQLALEAIPQLQDRYEVDFRFHLVGPTDRLHAPEPQLLADYARRDCALVAPHYGLSFATNAKAPDRERVTEVHRLLADLTGDLRFLALAIEAGHLLWAGNDEGLGKLSARIPRASEERVHAALESGNALRKKRGHYSGGMFWYAGEWYWGVDRLHHLERRWLRHGAARVSAVELPPRFDRPPIDPGPVPNDGQLELEVFPSLRSPYTALIFDESLRLAKRAQVPVTLRPVMPMVMRGVPAPAAKGYYIILDALREAKHLGVPFGDMFDPIGRPVERGFSLWPWARDQGRGAEFLSSFLRAAFAEGRNTGSDDGLRFVVERAGLDFEQARTVLDSEQWRDELEANRKLMYEELGLWGVPSYRLRSRLDEHASEPDLTVWGQDRLWLVAAEIRRRLA